VTIFAISPTFRMRGNLTFRCLNVSFPVSTSHHCFIQPWIHRRGSEEVPYQRSIPDFPKVQSQVIINSKFAIMVYESQISFTLDTICPWYVLSLLADRIFRWLSLVPLNLHISFLALRFLQVGYITCTALSNPNARTYLAKKRFGVKSILASG